MFAINYCLILFWKLRYRVCYRILLLSVIYQIVIFDFIANFLCFFLIFLMIFIKFRIVLLFIGVSTTRFDKFRLVFVIGP